MAQLKDTIVQGSLNVTNSITTDDLYTTGLRHHVLVGTGTAAVAHVAATDTTAEVLGKPALWKYDLGIATPQNGDMITILIPVAGHGNGVFVSLDNGTNYKPVTTTETARLTTHFPAGQFVTLIYDTDGSVASVFPVAGASAASSSITGGCWRVDNYYDSNTNTLLRTYALTSTTELPLVAGSTNTAGAWSNYTSSYKDLYGVIPGTAANRPTINPSTGLIKMKSLQLTSALPAGSGGTGHTSLINAANALINALDTGSSALTANDYVITQYVGGGSSTITYHRRPASAVVNATLVKAALGTDGSTTTQYLNKAGNWAALPTATTAAAGIVKVGSNISVSSGTISVPTATTAALGVMKVGTGLSVSSGTVSQTAHTFTIGNTSRNYNGNANVSWSLADIGAAASSHTHNYAAASHTHAYLSTSGGTLTGDLYINKATDVGGTNSNGSLVIGVKAGANIGIDTDEIHARNNNAVSTLYLNYEGGSIAALDTGTSYFVQIRSTKDSTAVSNGALAVGGGVGVGKNLCVGGNIYLAAGKHIQMNYNNTSYEILFNHNNGNVSLRAASGGLYLGYENTTLINFLNGLGQWTASTSSLTVNGTVNATTFVGALTGNASSTTRINGNLTGATDNTSCNIWISDATPTGVPRYVSGFYINPSSKLLTLPGGLTAAGVINPNGWAYRGDYRNNSTTPNTYNGIMQFWGLKTKAAVTSPFDDNYVYALGLRGWSDSSGGKSHEFAFADSGIGHRVGTTTTWDAWQKLVESDTNGHMKNTYSEVLSFGTTQSYTAGQYLVVYIDTNTSWMLSFQIRIYASYVHREYFVSGYNYVTPNSFYLPTVYCFSSNLKNTTSPTHTVYCGITGGTAGSVHGRGWIAFPLDTVVGKDYVGVSIVNVVNGFTQIKPTFSMTVSSLPSTNRTAVTCYSHNWQMGESITGAVWNDYAEYRQSHCEEPGYVVYENGNDTLSKTTQRLQHFAGIVSDTWGFCQGETELAKTPIAVSGRVLAYTYQNRNNYQPGDCVCAAPDGTVDIMTEQEIKDHPDRIVGTVSCVPTYEEWGNGDRPAVKVDGRIWIKVR